MTAVKHYMIETKTRGGEHLLFNFELVYESLVHCHLISSVKIFSTNTAKYFPGTDALDI